MGCCSKNILGMEVERLRNEIIGVNNKIIQTKKKLEESEVSLKRLESKKLENNKKVEVRIKKKPKMKKRKNQPLRVILESDESYHESEESNESVPLTANYLYLHLNTDKLIEKIRDEHQKSMPVTLTSDEVVAMTRALVLHNNNSALRKEEQDLKDKSDAIITLISEIPELRETYRKIVRENSLRQKSIDEAKLMSPKSIENAVNILNNYQVIGSSYYN